MGVRIDIDYNKIYVNKQGLPYKIIEDLGSSIDINSKKPHRYVKIRFLNSGYETIIRFDAVLLGKVKDYSEFERIHGKNYIKVKKSLTNDLDKKILHILYFIEARCYKPSDSAYKHYGALGVKVCDRWFKHPDLFIEDFKKLKGYEDWYNAPDDEKYKFHIDKDLKQQNIPINQRIYGPDTCIIVNRQFNSRLVHINKTKHAKYMGILPTNPYNPNTNWHVTIYNNSIQYNLGNYDSDIAAASIYNWLARQLPNTLINDLGKQEMSFEEALTHYNSNDRVIINIPSKVDFPSIINGKPINIIYDGSKYNQIKKFTFRYRRPSHQFGVFDENDNLINLYDNEMAAVNALEYYCQDNGLAPVNQIDQDQIISRDMVNKSLLLNETQLKLQSNDNKSKAFTIRNQKYHMWQKMYDSVVGTGVNFNYTNLSILDFKWHTLDGFINQIDQIDGYKEWEDAGFPDGYMIENYIKQSTVMPDQRVWNKDVCTIIKDPNYGIITQVSKEIINDEEYDNIKYYGVKKVGKNKYRAAVTMVKNIIYGNTNMHIGVFDDPIAAASAYNVYVRMFCNNSKRKRNINVLDHEMSVKEYQMHKLNIRQLYHLVQPGEKKRLYHIVDPTKEV